MQCPAVSTILGAISEPLQTVPCDPMMVTTERPITSGLATPPPTIACDGVARPRVAASKTTGEAQRRHRHLGADRGAVLPSAAAIAEISGFMKKASLAG